MHAFFHCCGIIAHVMDWLKCWTGAANAITGALNLRNHAGSIPVAVGLRRSNVWNTQFPLHMLHGERAVCLTGGGVYLLLADTAA